MNKDYSNLLSLICEIKLEYKRVNDLVLGDEQYSIGFYDQKEPDGSTEVRICLKDSKSNEYSLSIRQLAALRMKIGTIQATWLDEFRTDAGGAPLQDLAKDFGDNTTLESIRLKVVKQLKIKNRHTDTETPIYKDRCYEGAIDYTRGVRKLLNGKTREFFQTPEYGRNMAELRDDLHSTPVKHGLDIEENEVTLPIFELV